MTHMIQLRVTSPEALVELVSVDSPQYDFVGGLCLRGGCVDSVSAPHATLLLGGLRAGPLPPHIRLQQTIWQLEALFLILCLAYKQPQT